MKTFSVLAVGAIAVSATACSKTAISRESSGVQTAGTGGTSGAAGQSGGGGQAAAAGAAGAAGIAGTAGSGSAGGTAGAAGALSKLAFATPDIVEFGVRQAHCVIPVAWSKDGRKDVVTVHDETPAYTTSDEYKAYYDTWRIVNGKLTTTTGPVSLEPSPGAQVQVGTCATTDLDHDGVVEVTTSLGHHWIRPSVAPGKAVFFGGVFDLDADGGWEVVTFSPDGKTLLGSVVETKDGVSWSTGAVAYSAPVALGLTYTYAGDFDGDGREDLLLFDVLKTKQVQLVRASPGGPQVAPANAVLEDFFYPIVVDMNGDGRADLVGQGKQGYQVALSDGKGGFSTQLLIPKDATEGLAATDGFTVGDLSGDGWPDLVLDSPLGVYVLESDGPGVWRPARLAIDWKHTDPGTDTGQLHLLRVVDMDGDGKNDLVARRDLSLVAFRNLTPSP